jgi:hypothetical protein
VLRDTPVGIIIYYNDSTAWKIKDVTQRKTSFVTHYKLERMSDKTEIKTITLRGILVEDNLNSIGYSFSKHWPFASPRGEKDVPDVPDQVNVPDQVEVPDQVGEHSHYDNMKLEPIQVIETMGEDQLEGFCLGNALKYTMRAKAKNGIEDLQKAQWYLKYWEDYLARKSKN